MNFLEIDFIPMTDQIDIRNSLLEQIDDLKEKLTSCEYKNLVETLAKIKKIETNNLFEKVNAIISSISEFDDDDDDKHKLYLLVICDLANYLKQHSSICTCNHKEKIYQILACQHNISNEVCSSFMDETDFVTANVILNLINDIDGN